METPAYGLPYMGSKRLLADWILEFLPPADLFVDLFAGGCAVSHAAMRSGKFRLVAANDIDGAMPRLFAAAAAGKYRDESRWISRADFFRLRGADPYVRAVWSFGNNGVDYLYSREKEPWKEALWAARVWHDTAPLRQFGIDSDGSFPDIKRHAAEYKEKYIAWYIRTQWKRGEDYATRVRDLAGQVERGKEELRQYLLDALRDSGLTQADVDRRLGTKMAGHYFGKSQWAFPTREEYGKMRQFMPSLSPYEEVYGLQPLSESLQRLQRLQSLESLQSLQRLQSLQSLERLQSLQRLQRLQSLERLQSLQSLQCRLGGKPTFHVLSMDYADAAELVRRTFGAGFPFRRREGHTRVVYYADPPYEDTADYACGKFDHARFHDWLRRVPFPVWVSSYQMPPDFACLGRKSHRSLLSATANNLVSEGLFVHERWAKKTFRPTLF